MDSDPENQSKPDSANVIIESKKAKKQKRKKLKHSLNKNSTEKTKTVDEPSLEDIKDVGFTLQQPNSEDRELNECYMTNDEKTTKIYDINNKMSKYYVVNEEIFLDSEPTMTSDDEYHEYKLYKVMKTEHSGDVHRNDDELTDEDLEDSLLVTEELTRNGVILNNNVYLNNEDWNTIMKLSEDVYTCIVCQFQFDESMVAAHMKKLTHLRNLDVHRPLRRFDLSIIRKIRDHFHCGVCNVLFPIKSYQTHENSKTHEGNLLFAINKVSDLMWRSEKKTTQVFNTNHIKAPNNAPCATHDRNAWIDLASNTGSDWYIEPDSNEIAENALDIDYPDRNSEPVSNSESASYTEPNDTENTDVHYDTASDNFNFGHSSYKDIKIYEEDEIEEYNLPIEGVSYASMASKPRLDVPKFLKIDLGTKEVRVKYESWNMITSTNLNEYYCMVCKKTFHIRFKLQHCSDDIHKEALDKCNVVRAFEDYLIRNVSDTLYHCGHCNNLQYKNDIIIHIQKYHPIKNPTGDIKPLKLPPNEPNYTGNYIKKVMNTKFDIFGDFRFKPFGAEITLSNLNCHMIMRVDNKYMCGLCDVYIQGDLIYHVYDSNHIHLINMTPFIRPLRCNLTRAVRGSLHCAICNVLIPVKSIYEHNMDPKHTSAMARALGMVKNERPKQEVKFQNGGQVEFNTDLERFLSTLPPNTRDALSMLKIKNHKGEMFQLSDGTSSSSSGNSTPLSMSLNNSPMHIRKDINGPVYAQIENSYRQKGPDCINPIPTICYPKPGVEGINQGPEACYPIPGVGSNPVASYIPRPISSTGFYPNNEANINPNACYPTPGVQGINPPPYPHANPLFKPGQLIPLSMIESGLPGVRTGSPTSNAPLNIPLPLITGPFDLIMRSRVGCVPVSPIRRPVDLEVANELISLYNQSPGRMVHKITEPKVIEPKVNVPVMAPKVEKNWSRIEKIQDQRNFKVPETRVSTEHVKSELRKKILTSESDDDVTTFKLDEAVLVKLKSSYFKVTNSSYHTLVHHGNGIRFCFVCSSRVSYATLRKHIDSREHVENLNKNKFLYNFCGQLLRQMYLMYHCTICNVTMSRKEVKMHLEWPTHAEKYDGCRKKINKKFLKDLKTGTKEYSVDTQKECLYVNIAEPAVSVVTYVQSSRDDSQDIYPERRLERKSQMIILKENLVKISFESWHGITKNGTKCIICQTELKEGLMQHLNTKYHNTALGMNFEKHYLPSLLRKINEGIINCVICNLELSNDNSVVLEHINGRKHEKNYNIIIENTSRTDTYSDCYKYPITL